IEIPEIKCSLPIYHGTDESVLQIAVGHIDWTSLPAGGESTHCVLSGHRGLPSAKLFTNLDQLVEGDIFMLRILDETLTYEVDQILIVEPNDVDALQIVEGEDLCTLVTCTPYGINTHRLLVRGHRIENQEEAKTVRVTADALQIEPLIVAPIVAIPMLLVLLIWLLFKDTGKGKKTVSEKPKEEKPKSHKPKRLKK
ncbi:MAG: class C sortase, partial [Oscillospiraceae bacterium]